MTATFTELGAAAVPVSRSCSLLGRAGATYYRHARGPVHGPRPARLVPENGQALSGAERAAVLTLINTPAYADLSKSIGQIWARELDEGRYWVRRPRCIGSPGRPGRAGNGGGWRPTRPRSNPSCWPTARRRCGRGTSPGHHQAAWTGQGDLLPAVRADRHLLPVQPVLIIARSSPRSRTPHWQPTSSPRPSTATAPPRSPCTPTEAPR